MCSQCLEVVAACTSSTWVAARQPSAEEKLQEGTCVCRCQLWAVSSWPWSTGPSMCPTGEWEQRQAPACSPLGNHEAILISGISGSLRGGPAAVFVSPQPLSISLACRDHRLTMLLRESLTTTNCRTTMIAHISDSPAHHAETLSTVQLAARIHRLRRKKGKVNPISRCFPRAPRLPHPL